MNGRWFTVSAVCVCVLISHAPAPARIAHAAVVRYSCADGPVSAWYNAKTRFKVLSGCVIATGRAENIGSYAAAVTFELVPDRASSQVLNAHNLALLNGHILVYVYGRKHIHGRLLNGTRVQVAAPLIHNLTSGWNELPAARFVKVLQTGSA